MAKTQKVKSPNMFMQLLKSTISNQTAIDASKDHHWWVALIIAIFSVIIAVVPIFVSVVTVNGSDIFKAYYYDMDTNLQYMVENMPADKMVVKDGILSYSGKLEENGDIVKPYERKIRESGVIGFRAVFIDSYFSEINFKTYLEDSKYKRGPTSEVEYLPSFLFFYKDGFRIVLYPYSETASQITPMLDTGNGFKMKDIKDTNDFIGDWIKKDLPGKDLVSIEYMNNFKKLLNQAYGSTKTQGVLSQTGIYSGVYAGAILLLGLMIFLMTRGKRNPFNYMTFNDALKISGWASISPAILAVVFGFLMSTSSIGSIFFVLAHGLRVMWISMNQLRPQY